MSPTLQLHPHRAGMEVWRSDQHRFHAVQRGLPAAPMLAEIVIAGRVIPMLVRDDYIEAEPFVASSSWEPARCARQRCRMFRRCKRPASNPSGRTLRGDAPRACRV